MRGREKSPGNAVGYAVREEIVGEPRHDPGVSRDNEIVQETRASSDKARSELLSDPGLRRALSRSLEKRVPASEVDDLVQSTLLDAFAAETAPGDETELRRWVYGILRNKVANHYRARHREAPLGLDGELAPAESAPRSAQDLLRWAEKELPKGEGAEKTLDWLLEEADGEKLESIARAEKVPATRVRQRVARLRRHFRERWAAELAGIVATIVIVVVVGLFLRRHFAAQEPTAITPEPSARPELRHAGELRRGAGERCARRQYEECLHSLDSAKALDPAGDLSEPVQSMRAAARAALAREMPDLLEGPVPVPSATPSPAPSAKTRAPAPKSTAAPSILRESTKDGKEGGPGTRQKPRGKKASKAWSSSDVLSEPSPDRK